MMKSERTVTKHVTWLTIDESAEYLGLSRSTIYNLESKGLLKAYRLNSSSKRPILRFKQEDLDNLLMKRERGRPRQEVA